MADSIEQGTAPVADSVVPAAAPIDHVDTPAATPAVPAPVKQTAAASKTATPKPTRPKRVTKAAPQVAAAKPAKPAPAITAAVPVAKAGPVKTTTIKTRPIKTRPTKTPTSKPAKPAVAPVVRTATAPTKDTRIMTTPTTEITEKFQTAIKDASEKAKAAFEKSQASLGEMGEFTKGNVEALVESTKILATGLQALSKDYLAESKSVFETLTAEFKELTTVKTPSELLEKQSTMLRKQFDAAVAASSKNSEAMLKLASEAFQPISTRVSLAVEKVKKAA